MKLLEVTGNKQSRFLFHVGTVSVYTLWSVNLCVVFVHKTGFEHNVLWDPLMYARTSVHQPVSTGNCIKYCPRAPWRWSKNWTETCRGKF